MKNNAQMIFDNDPPTIISERDDISEENIFELIEQYEKARKVDSSMESKKPLKLNFLKDINVNLKVVFGEVSLTFEELIDLSEGKKISLAMDNMSEVSLFLDNDEIATSNIYKKGEEVYLQIKKVISAKDPSEMPIIE